MKKTTKKHQGFSLIEMIIYLGIATFVLLIVVQFSWSALGSNVRVEVNTELNQNARLVIDKFSQKTHSADDIITASSLFDSHPGILVLDMPGSGTDITFDTYTKNVDMGGDTVSIRKLRMQEGSASPLDLTSDQVNVSNLIFRDLSRGNRGKNINLELTINYASNGEDSARDQSLTIETGATIRKQ